MKNKAKSLYIFTVCILALLVAVPSVFAAQSVNATGQSSTPNTYPGNQPYSQKSDSEIKSAVQQAMARYKDVSVSVDNGVVTLSGQIVNDVDRKDAISAARDVAGVRSVHDQIQVTGADSHSVGEYFHDAEITAAVKANILKEKGLSTLHISVDTIGGVVTLTGSVKSQELANQVRSVASQTKGVKRVDNKLLVQP